jgi:hypothetical protein
VRAPFRLDKWLSSSVSIGLAFVSRYAVARPPIGWEAVPPSLALLALPWLLRRINAHSGAWSRTERRHCGGSRHAATPRRKDSILAGCSFMALDGGSGGLTSFSRCRVETPKTLVLDAVWELDAVAGWQVPALNIKAAGRGTDCRTKVNKHGMPRGGPGERFLQPADGKGRRSRHQSQALQNSSA